MQLVKSEGCVSDWDLALPLQGETSTTFRMSA